MNHVDAVKWKHTTTLDSRRHGEPTGVDFYDDEQPGYVSIYQSFKDGTRFPARTVCMASDKANEILDSWSNHINLNKQRVVVNDYRGQTFPQSHIIQFDREMHEDEDMLVDELMAKPHQSLADTAFWQLDKEFLQAKTRLIFHFDPASFRLDRETGHYSFHCAIAFKGTVKELVKVIQSCYDDPDCAPAGMFKVVTDT